MTELAARDGIKQIGPDAFCTFCLLKELTDGIGEYATSVDDLAAMMGISRKRVIDATKILQAAGVIERRKQQRKDTIYSLKVSKSQIDTSRLPTTTLINTIEEKEVSKSDFDTSRLSGWGEFISAAQVGVLYQEITGRFAIPGGEMDKTVTAIEAIWRKHRAETVGFLKPFYREAVKRYGPAVNDFWAYDWGVKEAIPSQNGKNGKPADETWKQKYTAVE